MDWEPLVFETTTAKVLAEFDKKYRGTFMRLNNKLVYVKGMDNPFLYFTGVNEEDFRIKVDTKETLSHAFPPVGCFSTDDNFAVFQRVPLRQFKKGLCSDNARILYPLLPTQALVRGTIGFKPIQQATDGGHVSFMEGVARLVDRRPLNGVAITREWALAKHPKIPRTLLLFFRHFVVGELDVDDGGVRLAIPSFEQEVKDLSSKFALGLSIHK